MSRRAIYPLEVRNNLFFLRVAVSDAIRQPTIARLLEYYPHKFCRMWAVTRSHGKALLRSQQQVVLFKVKSLRFLSFQH